MSATFTLTTGMAYVRGWSGTVAGGAMSLSSLTVNGPIQLGAGPTLVISQTAPTISSGFGASPSIANNNGTAAFTVNVGTGGVATAGVVGLPAATTGWNCYVENITAAAGNRANTWTVQTASTTNTASFQNQTVSTGAATAWTASDILRVSCFAY